MKVFVSHPIIALPDSVGERDVFLDIETTGLSRERDAVYQVGLLFWEEPDLVTQEHYLAAHRGEERELMCEVAKRLERFERVITYNGDAFDIPFLAERARRLRMTTRVFDTLAASSLDIFKKIRPYKTVFGWHDLKLKTMEKYLGIARADEFNGGELIALYDEYAATGDERLERILLLHNLEDVANMPPLMELLQQTGRVGGFSPDALEYDAPLDRFVLSDKNIRPFGFSLEVETEEGAYYYQKNSNRVIWEPVAVETTLKYYLPDFHNYYLLPATNELVHASLATGIKSAERRKALRDEVYVVKTGRFASISVKQAECLRFLHPNLRFYKKEYSDKKVFLAWDELIKEAQSGQN